MKKRDIKMTVMVFLGMVLLFIMPREDESLTGLLLWVLLTKVPAFLIWWRCFRMVQGKEVEP